MAKHKTMPQIVNNHGLLTYQNNGDEKPTCLGFLFSGPQHGIFDPELGGIEVTPEVADVHNKLLSQALIDGLDTCEIGQSAMFYLVGDPRGGNPLRITTWTGDLVADRLHNVSPRRYNFQRGGRWYKAICRQNSDLVTVTRYR
jgi:hypothetical protein